MTRRITTLLSLVLAMSLSLAACGGCGDDNNGEDPNNGATNNGTNSGRPTAGPGQMVVVEGPEIDLASAAVNGRPSILRPGRQHQRTWLAWKVS